MNNNPTVTPMDYAKIEGRVHSVETFGALDGPGVRYVLFLKGCPLRCLYCHNPDAINPSGGLMMKAGDVVRNILDYKNYIRSGGVTISGGEPLLQPAFCEAVAKLLAPHGIPVALDTSGAVPLAGAKDAINAAQMLLLDIKALDPALCKQVTGQDNQNALTILSYCESLNKPVIIRHVMVPGLTFDDEKLVALADFLAPYRCVQKVELLPFSKLGEFKYKELGRPYTLYDTPALTEKEAEHARAIFRERGFDVL